MRRYALLLLLALPLVAHAAPAGANQKTQLSIMMDDDQLLYEGAAARESTLQRMQAIGVDYVRVTVLWRNVAVGMQRSKRHRGADPKAYRPRGWDLYDGLVRAAKNYKIGVYFNVTGPGPKWYMGKPPRSERKYADTWKPNPRAFGAFVKATGRRYSGSYRDENEGRRKLPRVSFWSIFNEPNQAGWLTPQYKGTTPWSPVMYRDLWYYGRRGLNQSGHKKDVVLIGETAPLGNSNTNAGSPVYPKRFITEFFCTNLDGARLHGRSASRRRCKTLKRITPLDYTAWAHHPYTKKVSPKKRDSSRLSITMANVGELGSLLDRIKVKRTGLAQLNLTALTEFGYETNPPDPFSGISLAKQAEYINIGDHIAYSEPRVIANTQFLLRDGRGIGRYRKADKRHWFLYQSGLFTAKGKPKPAAIAYRFPLVITDKSPDTTSLWGWLRFLPRGVKTKIRMQFKPAGTKGYVNVGDPVDVTNPNGFFETTQERGGPGTWRALFWNPYSGAIIGSREVKHS
ncbi:MAG: hypothetical protein QOI80_107 [Solirubrobacteraceae bacterium]|nr:hypothetical protein [Solirubrobacteraceae bacterium]